jgi:hypothetical protein
LKNSEELLEFWEDFRAFDSGHLSYEDVMGVLEIMRSTNFFPTEMPAIFIHPDQAEALQNDKNFIINSGRKQEHSRLNQLIREKNDEKQ